MLSVVYIPTAVSMTRHLKKSLISFFIAFTVHVIALSMNFRASALEKENDCIQSAWCAAVGAIKKKLYRYGRDCHLYVDRRGLPCRPIMKENVFIT